MLHFIFLLSFKHWQNITLATQIDSGVWGTPANFNGFRVLPSITAVTSLTRRQPNFARCLAVSWAGTQYIRFWGLLAPWRNFARCKIHFTSKSCILLYWEHYCSGLQPNFVAWYTEWNYVELSQRRHLYSTGWPSHWVLAHILVLLCLTRQQICVSK